MRFSEHLERGIEKEIMHSFAFLPVFHFHDCVKVKAGAELS